ncbi:helix-turn-helix transcriptional regulator [Streptomyces sp. NPDC051567]|uniref:helix-turn-helix transcriptional regulator n=1 Tax=Streptomyces sp. NPDC051567 TaxID=3365660 RepID=UPI0037ACFE59
MRREPEDVREVVAGLLGDERLLTACAQRDMGAVFTLLNHRGVSTRRIASAVGVTQGRLYDYMNGTSRVEKLTIFEQIADAFHIPGHLLGLAHRPWQPAVRAAAVLPPVAVPQDDDDLAAMGAFRDADRQTGGGRLYGAVLQHLSGRLGPRLVDAHTGPHIFAAAAAMTEMAGWMAHDSGRDDLAARHFARALPLARTAGDSALTANIAASSSHLALQAGDLAAAVHWARTGLEAAATGADIASLTARLHAMQARALAAAGQDMAAARALDHSTLGGRPGPSHPWVSPFDAAALASESVLVLRDLGRYERALECAERSVSLREAGRARSIALARIALAGLHATRREFDAAVSTGNELLDALTPALGSVRVVRQLDGLTRALDPHRGYRPVSEFLVRLGHTRRTRTLLLADILSPAGGGR